MKIAEVRIFEHNQRVPRIFKCDKKRRRIEVLSEPDGWVRIFLYEEDRKGIVSIPMERIDSLEISEVPDDVEPTEPSEEA